MSAFLGSCNLFIFSGLTGWLCNLRRVNITLFLSFEIYPVAGHPLVRYSLHFKYLIHKITIIHKLIINSQWNSGRLRIVGKGRRRVI